MKRHDLLGEELLTLQNERGNICVSIIVPTHRLSHERTVDRLAVVRACDMARQMLKHKYKTEEIGPLLGGIDALFKDIDFVHNADGIGMYISANTRRLVRFPFPVEEKVMVGDNFELRDLLYKVSYSVPYFVLALTEKNARFFEGSWDELQEINDNYFPKEYVDEYLYNAPSQSTSYSGYAHVKAFELDKSVMEEIRFKDFFCNTDEWLAPYLVGKTPLILFGVEKELGWFAEVTGNET
jgi:hypothetical protein